MSLIQRSNLLAFLKRGNMTGEEAEAFVEILQIIANAEGTTKKDNK